MALMTDNRTLYDDDGDATGIVARYGAKVAVLATKPPWLKVRLLDDPATPVGWVSLGAVDQRPDAKLGPMDEALFALECCRQAAFDGISPHYMMAVASLRTKITDGPGDGGTGPFALSPDEWSFFGRGDYFDPALEPIEISNWYMQCAVFGAMTYVTQQKLADLLGDQPTATELYLAQLIGTKACVAAVNTPGDTVEALLTSVADADLQDDCISKATALTRYADLLKTDSAKTSIDRIGTALQKALDATASFIRTAGGQPMPATDGHVVAPPPIVHPPPTVTSPPPPPPHGSARGLVPAPVAEAARASAKKWRVPASVSLAQWALESAWGRAMPAGSNNPFGIKATRGQPFVRAWTKEEVNGRQSSVVQSFRAFNSVSEAFDAHGQLLATAPFYRKAMAVCDSPLDFAANLTAYATASNYTTVLRGMMKSYNLLQYDA